jgi:hypothetical protein
MQMIVSEGLGLHKPVKASGLNGWVEIMSMEMEPWGVWSVL